MPSPGTNAHVEVTTQLLSADTPRDYCVCNFSFNTGSTSVSAANWQALVDAIKNVWFATSGAWLRYSSNGGKVVAYDRADPKPRPEKAFSNYVPTTWATAVNVPRQDSIAVSFYSSRNLPRLRGRVYLPPHPNWTSADIIGSPQLTQAMALVNQIETVAIALTPAWQLGIYSEVLDQTNPVTTVWVNDVWDVQRRRARKETLRLHTP